MSFKKRAPRAIKEIRGFAQQAMVSFLLQFISVDCDKKVMTVAVL